MEPIRSFLSRTGTANATYIQASAESVDFQQKVVTAQVGTRTKYPAGISAPGQPQHEAKLALEYDKLIIAVGAEPATFGIPGVQEHALFMKEVDDGAIAQQRILGCLERAEALLHAGAPEQEISKLLHFVIVGGGPTGVELTAELSDFIRGDVNRLFPRLQGRIRVSLVEAMPRVLAPFRPEIAQIAADHLQKSDVEVRCNTAIKKVSENTAQIQTKGSDTTEQLDFGVLVWAAGITTRPLVARLAQGIGTDAGQDSRRGLVVDSYLRVKGVDGVYALGDCAVSGCPPTAQVAAQQGKWLGRRLRDDEVEGAKPFVYQHLGTMAYVGNKEAVAQIKPPLGTLSTTDHFWWRMLHGAIGEERTLTGTGAFVFWRSVYFSKMLSVKNRASIALDWFKTETHGRDVAVHQAPMGSRLNIDMSAVESEHNS